MMVKPEGHEMIPIPPEPSTDDMDSWCKVVATLFWMVFVLRAESLIVLPATSCAVQPSQSTIDNFRQHINGMRGGECLEFLRGLEDAQNEVERLRDELASVREDAARYAWLASNAAHISARRFTLGGMFITREKLDAAIDAARKDG